MFFCIAFSATDCKWKKTVHILGRTRMMNCIGCLVCRCCVRVSVCFGTEIESIVQVAWVGSDKLLEIAMRKQFNWYMFWCCCYLEAFAWEYSLHVQLMNDMLKRISHVQWNFFILLNFSFILVNLCLVIVMKKIS